MSELTDLLGELDIALGDMDKPETLTSLYEKYESMVTQAEEAGEKQESVLKQTIELLNKDEELVKTINTLRLKYLAEFQKLIDKDPRVAIMAVELFQTLKQSMMYERDYMMTKSVVPITKKAAAANEDAELKKSLAKKLKRLLEIAFEMQDKPKGIIPTKESKTEGVKIKVSNLPRSESSSENPVGIAARNSKLRFAVDGKELPADTTPADLAYRYVSDRGKGVTITWPAISNAVKESGQQVLSGRWKIEAFNHVIEGWKVEDKVEETK